MPTGQNPLQTHSTMRRDLHPAQHTQYVAVSDLLGSEQPLPKHLDTTAIPCVRRTTPWTWHCRPRYGKLRAPLHCRAPAAAPISSRTAVGAGARASSTS